jgi:hypothetical protein
MSVLYFMRIHSSSNLFRVRWRPRLESERHLVVGEPGRHLLADAVDVEPNKVRSPSAELAYLMATLQAPSARVRIVGRGRFGRSLPAESEPHIRASHTATEP